MARVVKLTVVKLHQSFIRTSVRGILLPTEGRDSWCFHESHLHAVSPVPTFLSFREICSQMSEAVKGKEEIRRWKKVEKSF